jgi:fluoroquinolone resistance protein
MTPSDPDFTQERYADLTFFGVQCAAGELAGKSFEKCQFAKCTFDRASLVGATFADCVFEGCRLVVPKLGDCGLRGVTFSKCKLSGVDFTRCNVNFFDLAFLDCLMDACNFSALPLRHAKFTRSEVRDCVFSETKLEGADFTYADLAGTTFHQCALGKANFAHARNYAIDVTANVVKDAVFMLPDAVSLLRSTGAIIKDYAG